MRFKFISIFLNMNMYYNVRYDILVVVVVVVVCYHYRSDVMYRKWWEEDNWQLDVNNVAAACWLRRTGSRLLRLVAVNFGMKWKGRNRKEGATLKRGERGNGYNLHGKMWNRHIKLPFDLFGYLLGMGTLH